ncbi:hypothetical protein HZS_3862 [Henneguya salminicola]|nr:hypothetical protein HZS_3862 [Henneguya salminicola]
MIWAKNETLALLRYNSHVFIDATFRSTPKYFSQYLVKMKFDLDPQTFVPRAYASMTSKLEYLYSVNQTVDDPYVKEFLTYFEKTRIKSTASSCDGALKVFSTIMSLLEGRIIVLTEKFATAHFNLAPFVENPDLKNLVGVSVVANKE